jgi:transposase
MRYTFAQFKADYPDSDACLQAVFDARFGDLQYCPRCAAETKFYRVKKRQCFACMHCGHQLHPLADTIFRKTTTSLWDWFYAIYLFSVGKNGVSAKELERHLGVTYKTAWRMAKQIRLLMAQDGGQLTGIVEVDETYIGGRAKHDRKFANKTAVIGIVEREKGAGQVKAVATKQADASIALPFMRAAIKQGTAVHSDESRIYHRVKREFAHQVINHAKGEYAREGVTTNTIEGFWSQMKRSIDGTYHCVSPKYLQLYVDEFAFRYNHRGAAVGPALLARAAMRVG